jgi:hypothetical protein
MTIQELEYSTKTLKGLGRGHPGMKETAEAKVLAPQTAPVTVRDDTAPSASAPVATGTAQVNLASTRYKFLGIDITDLVNAWNDFRKKVGLGAGKHPGRGAYESGIHSQRMDGTINELEKKG